MIDFLDAEELWYVRLGRKLGGGKRGEDVFNLLTWKISSQRLVVAEPARAFTISRNNIRVFTKCKNSEFLWLSPHSLNVNEVQVQTEVVNLPLTRVS